MHEKPLCASALFAEFIDSLLSDKTRVSYSKGIEILIDGMNPDDFIKSVKADKVVAESFLLKQVIYHRGRVVQVSTKGKILSPATLRMWVACLKSFCDFEEVVLNWVKIRKALPKARSYGSDRPPKLEEIRMLYEICPERDRVAVLVLMSSGCRCGAFDWFNVGDYSKFKSGVGKLIIYRGEPEEYVAFISPEASVALDKYLDSRREIGEKLADNSPLFRNVWDCINWHGAKDPAVSVKRYTGKVLSNNLYHYWLRCKVKKVGDGRGVLKNVHGFRKFFKTRSGQVMKSDDVELLMGHSLGISDSYYKPSLDVLEKEYLKAVPLLTISEVEEVKREGEKIKRVQDKEISELKDSILKIMRRVDSVEKQLE